MSAHEAGPEAAGMPKVQDQVPPVGTGSPINTGSSISSRRLLKRGVQTIVMMLGLRLGAVLVKHLSVRAARRFRGNQPADSTARPAGLQLQRVASCLQVSALTDRTSANHWQVLDASAPPIPKEYREVISQTLPCTVYEFYHHLLLQSTFLQQQHEQIGRHFNYVGSTWQPSPLDLATYPYADDKSMLQPLGKSVFEYALEAGGPGGFVRTATFTTPKKAPSPCETMCVQRQQLAVFSGQELIFTTVMNTLNAPFKECFTVNAVWHVLPGPEPQTCVATVHFKVNFVSRCFVSGIIRATTTSEMSSFYKALFIAATTLLASAPRMEPEQGNWQRAANLLRTGSMRAPRDQLSSGASGPRLASPQLLQGTAMPWPRQLRMLLASMLLLGCVVHQVLLASQLADVRRRVGGDHR